MYQFHNPSDQLITDYLQKARRIAVVGLSNRPETASYQVAQFMQSKGYEIIPVNPRLAGQTVLGQVVYAQLTEVPEPIDIVDVFRCSEALPEVARAFSQTKAKVFWAQLGLFSQEAAQYLSQANRHDVVMDKCLKIEYLRLLG